MGNLVRRFQQRPDEPVEHFVDGRKAWLVGPLGLLTRKRGIVATGLLTLVTMGVPWWWPGLPSTATIHLPTTALGAIVVLGTALLGGQWYLRYRTRRSLRMKYLLHRITHQLRDQLVRHIRLSTTNEGHLRRRVQLYKDLASTCELIRDYFRTLMGEDDLSVALRVLKRTSEGYVFRTVARSSGLHPERDRYTRDLPINEGLARYLAKKGGGGVLIYHDIFRAAKVETFNLGPNERRFPEDIRSLMVAPLTVQEEEDKTTIGLLYVTSSHSNRFDPIYTDSLLFVADAVAAMLWSIFRAYFPLDDSRRSVHV